MPKSEKTDIQKAHKVWKQIHPKTIWKMAWSIEQILAERSLTEYEEGRFDQLKHILELMNYPYSEKDCKKVLEVEP